MRPRGVDGGSEKQNGEKRERGGCRENRNIYICNPNSIFVNICGYNKNPNGIFVNICGAGQIISVTGSGQIF